MDHSTVASIFFGLLFVFSAHPSKDKQLRAQTLTVITVCVETPPERIPSQTALNGKRLNAHHLFFSIPYSSRRLYTTALC